MSGSLALEGFVRLQGGEDGLGGNAPIGDELSTRSAGSRRERRRPPVLIHDDPSHAPGFHRGGEVRYIVLGEELSELSFKPFERPEIVEVGQLDRVEVPVVVLDEDEQVDEPDSSGVDEREELVGHVAVEGALPGGNSTMTKSTGPSSSTDASVMVVRPFVDRWMYDELAVRAASSSRQML
jgi:hypothetical protein